MRNFISLKGVLVTVAVLFGVSITSTSLANTFTVTSTEDIGKDAITADCTCRATGKNYCTLRAAVETANKCVPVGLVNKDSIVLTAGNIYKIGKHLEITSGSIKISATAKTSIDAGKKDRIFYVKSGTTLNLENLALLNGNHGLAGGAIFNLGTLSLTKSSIEGSDSGMLGGAIYSSGNLTIDKSTIGPINTAGSNGGGIANKDTATITNSTISGNTSKLNGGGIYSSDTAKLKHVTVTGNTSSSGEGDGIFAEANSSFSLNNSIVIGNNEKDCGGQFSGKGNIFYSICLFPNDGNDNKDYAGPSLLKPLAENGGFTKTHALEAIAGAIDAANAAYAVTVDQRGYNRDPAADVGAYEYIGKCGDGLAQKAGLKEQCDDGNVVDKDGCNATCQLEPKISIDKTSVDFEKVAIGSEKSVEITIKKAVENESILKISAITINVGGTISSLPYQGDNFSANTTCVTNSAITSAGCTITAKFNPSAKGVLSAQLAIKSNDPNTPETTLALTGEGFDDAVVVNPLNIIFSDAKLGEPVEQDLVISYSGIEPISISLDKSALNGFSIETVSCDNDTVAPNGGSCSFKVGLSAQEAKVYSGTLTINTTHPKFSSFTIPITATVTPPVISIDQALDFGKVLAGGSKELSITIKNTGSSKSPLEYALPASANFSLSATCSEVPAMSSCETKVKFHPLTNIIDTLFDQFTIISKDPANPQQIIQLWGTTTAPHIALDTQNIDFGSVVVGESKKKTLLIANIGTSDLTVKEFKQNNSETAFSISYPADDPDACKSPSFVIKPSEHCKLWIEFGPFEVANASDIITIESDSQFGYSAVQVDVLGIGVPKPLPYLSIPNKVTLNDTVIDQTSSKAVSLSNEGQLTLTITEVLLSDAGFELSPDDATPCGNTPISLVPGSKCGYNIEFNPTQAMEYNGTLAVTSDTGGVQGSKSQITITGKGKPKIPELYVVASDYDFGELNINKIASDTIKISNNGFAPLIISAIDDVSDKVNFSLVGKENCIKTLAPSEECEFGVDFNPKAVGSFDAYIVVHSNDTKNANYEIIFAGKAIGPIVSVAPMELSFSKVLVGDLLTLPLKIMNTSAKADLKVTDMSISGTGYLLNVSGGLKYCESTTPVVQAGDHCIVGVVFKPASAGVFDGKFKMSMEDLSDVEVTVSGIGYTEDGPVPSKTECGNGVTESGEACDDGNKNNGDGCSAECKVEDVTTIATTAVCGNGAVETGEDCDDGNAVDTDACSNTCKTVVASATTGGETGGAGAGGSTSSTEESGGGGGGGCSLIRQ